MPLVSGARARCGAPALVLALALAGGGCAGGEAAVPRAPTGLSAVAGNRAVTLTFDSDPALKYAVYFAKSPDVTKDDSRLLAESPFRHRDLENGTRLYYRVAAFNNVGESELSAEVAAEPSADATSPGAPASVTAVGGDGQITVDWGKLPGATSYTVYRDSKPGVFPGNGTSLSTIEPPLIDTGLVNGQTYYYVVTARRDGDESLPSAEASATANGSSQNLAAPSGLTAQAGDGQVTLSWGAVAGASDYAIYFATTPGVTPQSGSELVATTSPYVHASLTNGTTYYYVVVARRGAERSPPSSEANATPMQGSTVLPAPQNLAAQAGDKQVTLSWSAVTGATGYTLYFATSPGVTPQNGTALPGVSSPHVHGALTNGTTYYYVVVAQGPGGPSAPSAPASATPTAGTPPVKGAISGALSAGAYAVILLENLSGGTGLVQVQIYTADPLGSPAGQLLGGLSVTASGAISGALPGKSGQAGVYENVTAAPLTSGSYVFTVSGARTGTLTLTVNQLASCTLTAPVQGSTHKAGMDLALTWTSQSSEKAQILLSDVMGTVTYPPQVPDPGGVIVPGTDIPNVGALDVLVSAVWSVKSASAGGLFLGDCAARVNLN